MKVGVFQFAPEFGDVPANLGRIEAAVTGSGADLVVLPELCTTGYRFASAAEARSLAEPVPGGGSVRRLEALCRSARVFIAAGLAESADGGVYNSAVLVGPDGWIGTYRKVHLFHEEKRWFLPGNLGFRVWDAGPARVGLMVCFDWIFPEAARTLALAGADVLLHPANLVLPFCPDAMVTRCLENRVFSATANRTGFEDRAGQARLAFTGSSQIVSPRGEILFRMGPSEEGVRVADIDPAAARNKRVTELNDLFLDRRPGAYGPGG